MYTGFLILHSWLRWIVLIAALGATLSAVGDDSGPDRVGRTDRWGMILMMTLDLQMLIGLLLYLVISPNMAAIREDFAAAMKVPIARFWAVEHIGGMLLAVVLVHVGRVLARNAKTAAAKRTRMLVCFGLALLLITGVTPWPGMTAGRPLFRFFR